MRGYHGIKRFFLDGEDAIGTSVLPSTFKVLQQPRQ